MSPKKRLRKGAAADKASSAPKEEKPPADPNKPIVQIKLPHDKKKRTHGVPKKIKLKKGFDHIQHVVDVIELKDQLSKESFSTSSSLTYQLSFGEDETIDTQSEFNDEDIDLFDNLDDSVDDDKDATVTSSSEELKQETYEKVKIELEDLENFLTDLAQMPNIDGLSFNLSDINFHKETTEDNASAPNPDFEKWKKLLEDFDGSKEEFVHYNNALDDADIQEIEEIEEQVKEEQVEEESSEIEEEDTDKDFSPTQIKEEYINFDFDEHDKLFDEIDDLDIKPEKAEKESALVDFLTMEDIIHVDPEVVEISIPSEEEEQYSLIVVNDFLNNLIDECVNTSEIMDISAFMKRHLKKRALITKLYGLVPNFSTELSVRQFLNQKCVEHFRRLRNYGRALETTKNANVETERQYVHTLNELDKMLGREQATIEHVANLKDYLKIELEDSQNEIVEQVRKFETVFSHSLNPINSPKIRMLIESSLRQFAEVRRDVGNWRLKIIKKQHIVASLHKQLRELEDLGNGLCMATYDTIQTDITNVFKKLEERTVELNRLRNRCHSNIHAMAHLIEKVKMLRDAIIIQKSFLERKRFEKECLRKRIGVLKAQHSRIRKDIREWSFRSGLLDKPILLADYYKTIREGQRRSTIRSELRSEIRFKRRTISGLVKYKCKPPADFNKILLAKIL